jgi:predicted Zn-dependent protease with MMP-like domain
MERSLPGGGEKPKQAMVVDDEWFQAEVAAALDSLPAEFAERLENIEIGVERWPSPEQRRAARIQPWQTLYGLYQGVPLPARSSGYMLVPPDLITIFSEPLLHDFPDEAGLRTQVRRVVLHEIAHYFGISDARLLELGAY